MAPGPDNPHDSAFCAEVTVLAAEKAARRPAGRPAHLPGFHYFDRRRQTDIHFPRRGHAALVEARQAAGRRGIVDGGSTYGCVFTGGADNNLFSFASLTRPSGSGLLAALSPFVVVAWVCLKNLLRTVVELVRAVARLVAHPARARQG